MRCDASRTCAPVQAKAVTTRPLAPARRFGAGEQGKEGRVAALPAGPDADFSYADVPLHACPAPAGLPEPLKGGVERLSGVAMDDVRVHRDSPEPGRLGALAFARGRDIHLGRGQERHLPHEAWHVVQQMQGRVPATTQMKAIGLNDDVALETEADRLGRRAAGGIGSGPATTHAVDDTALQLPEQVAGWDLSAEAKKARERVAKEAEEKFDGDYRKAYLALRRDPTLWAEYWGGGGKNAMRTFVYLPSYKADPWRLNLSVDFELPVEVGNYSPQAAVYPNITIADVVETIDKDSAASILKATTSLNADVMIEAVLWLDTFDSADPPGSAPTTTVPIEPITIANVEVTRENLIPSGTAAVGSSGLESATLTFRLAGKITAAGTEWTMPVGLPVDAKDSKENAVNKVFPR